MHIIKTLPLYASLFFSFSIHSMQSNALENEKMYKTVDKLEQQKILSQKAANYYRKIIEKKYNGELISLDLYRKAFEPVYEALGETMPEPDPERFVYVNKTNQDGTIVLKVGITI